MSTSTFWLHDSFYLLGRHGSPINQLLLLRSIVLTWSCFVRLHVYDSRLFSFGRLIHDSFSHIEFVKGFNSQEGLSHIFAICLDPPNILTHR